ncbi:MAG: hypothetical protein ABII90_01015, partial [Bacteroidota bacterium]
MKNTLISKTAVKQKIKRRMRMRIIIVTATFAFFAVVAALIFIFNIGDIRGVKGGVFITAIATGNWSDGSIWNTGIPPSSSDDVIIQDGYEVTVDADASCASITINAPGSKGNSDITINNDIILNVYGDVTINGGTTNIRKARLFFKNNSVVIITGSLTVNSVSDQRAVIDMTTGTSIIELTGSLNLNTTVSFKNGQNNFISFNGNLPQVFPASSGIKFNDVYFNNISPGGIIIDADITDSTVTGNLRVQSGIFDNNGYDISGRGPKTFEVTNGAKFILKGTSSFPGGFNTIDLDPASAVQYDGDGLQTISAQNYGHLISSNTGDRVLSPSGTIGIAGDFIPGSNNYIITGSTVVFNGNNTQYINGSDYFTFHDLTVNKSDGELNLNVPVTIDNLLTLTKGKINTSTINLLILESTAGTSCGSVSSFINGPAAKVTNTTSLFTFHIGKNGYYRPLSIEPTSNDNTIFIAEFTDSSYPDITSLEPGLDNVSNKEYFQLDKSGNADSRVILCWNGNTNVNTSDPSELRVTRWDGAQWTNMG